MDFEWEIRIGVVVLILVSYIIKKAIRGKQ